MDGLQKKKACTAFNGGKNPPKHRITATIEATIRQILQCNYNDCAKSLYQEGKILELVAAFANEMMDQNSVAVKGSLSWADSETLLRVRRQIDEGFLEPVTIAELSKQHFMCESKLREIFRKHYGITIYQYMLNRRMEHACELLSVPDAQVKDIAGLVGYSNISHFSDAFRKKFGALLSEYKPGLTILKRRAKTQVYSFVVTWMEITKIALPLKTRIVIGSTFRGRACPVEAISFEM